LELVVVSEFSFISLRLVEFGVVVLAGKCQMAKVLLLAEFVVDLFQIAAGRLLPCLLHLASESLLRKTTPSLLHLGDVI
jgi:hypothetical protein